MFRSTIARSAASRAAVLVILSAALMACSGNTSTSPSGPLATLRPSSATATATQPDGSSPPAGSVSPGSSLPPAPTESSGPADTQVPPTEGGATASPEPDATGGTTTGGDIPDNAVFLTYTDAALGFSIQYVEGWQVSTTNDGVSVTDKDSRETVQVLPTVADIKGFISGTDIPALQATEGFNLLTQDTVQFHGKQVDHLQYRQLSPPDPVTNKRLPSLVDRYYFPGANGLAVLTLSTPKDVDNVDAFKRMAASFAWK